MSKHKTPKQLKRAARRLNRQWQKTAECVANLCMRNLMNDPLDSESEEVLQIIHPEGHRIASFARFMGRGPRALLPEKIKESHLCVPVCICG